MNKNKVFIGIISTSCLVIIAIGLFFSTGSYNIMAEGITTIINEDSIKEYDLTEQEVTIKDIDEKSLVKIKLITPLDNKVGLGYQRVAEYKINSIESLKILVSEMEYYDISDSMKEIERTIDYKIKNIEEINITDYETICKNITDEETIDKDLINIEENCITKIIGSHLENKTTWLSLDKVNFLRDENIIVGLYTDVQKGDKIEWIPTFQIDDNVKIRVEEWASWTADLNTDLVSYYKFSDDTKDSKGSNDLTNSGATYTASGKIGGAYSYITNDYMRSTSANLDITGAVTLNMWVKFNSVAETQIIAGEFSTSSHYQSYGLILAGGKVNTRRYSSAPKDITLNTPSVDTWYMYTHVINSDGSSEGYLNGVSKGTKTTEAKPTVTQFLLGKFDTNEHYLNGLIDEVGIWERALTSTEVTQLWNGGDGINWTDYFPVDCIFSGYVKDESGTDLVGANVTIWNQYNISESYENTTIAGGKWSLNITNSTNTYMAGAYYNNTLIGQLKPYISGTC
jgi:hypothetical protein